MLFSVSMFPVCGHDSLAEPISAVIEEIEEACLPYEVSAMDTVIEGDWEEVMPVLECAYRRLRRDYDRVYFSVTGDDHGGLKGRLEGAVDDVDAELGFPVAR